MNNATEVFSTISPKLAEALRELAAAAVQVAAHGIERQSTPDRASLMKAVDDGDCALAVQIDLPSGRICVLADGRMFAEPELLFAVELPEQQGERKFNA